MIVENGLFLKTLVEQNVKLIMQNKFQELSPSKVKVKLSEAQRIFIDNTIDWEIEKLENGNL